MRKRERENPCGVCCHYHKPDEVCGVCGHRPNTITAEKSTNTPQQRESAFPTEILKDFLYLGSYDNASRSELLKTIGISRILNTVPACQNLYKNSFVYHCLQNEKLLQFDDAIGFLEQCEKEKARVLVHCMTGKNKSPAIVMGYLMKCKGWRLQQSFQWVKDRRPQIELSPAIQEQLAEYEKVIFGSNVGIFTQSLPQLDLAQKPAFGFASAETNIAPVPMFSQGSPSIFERTAPDNFTFGAGNETLMDSS